MAYDNTTSGLTATNVKTAIDELAGGSGSVTFSGCRVYQSVLQTINTTATVVNFGAELFDTNSYHDNATNNSRITIPTSGYYTVQ